MNSRSLKIQFQRITPNKFIHDNFTFVFGAKSVTFLVL